MGFGDFLLDSDGEAAAASVACSQLLKQKDGSVVAGDFAASASTCIRITTRLG